MKKLLLIAGIILMSWAVNAQYFNMNSHWTEMVYHTRTGNCNISHYTIGDTFSINGVVYNEWLVDDELYAGLRETNDGKLMVYYYEDNREYQIYDFDWHIAETIGFYNLSQEDSIPFLISNLDSMILQDGNYHKYLKVFNDTLIQGMGFTKGFHTYFLSNSQPTNYLFATLCFYIDDQLVYINPSYNTCVNCDSLQLNNKFVEPSGGIKHFRHSGYLFIDFSALENKVESVFVYSMDGRLLFETNNPQANSVALPNLNKGAFIYVINTSDHKSYTGKLIIQ